MLASSIRVAVSRSVSSSLRARSALGSVTATRCFGAETPKADGPTVIVPLIAESLEWTLSSPPPLHQFDEPPLLVETDHMKHVNPGADVEAVLEAQGEKVTEVVGAEAYVEEEYTPEKFEAWVQEQDEKFEKAEAALSK